MPSQQEKEQVYWDAQVRAVTSLRSVGIVFNIDDRLPPFKLLSQFRKTLRSGMLTAMQLRAITEAIASINDLVECRVNGYEPFFKDGKYVVQVEGKQGE